MADGERTAGKAARTGEPARRYAAFVSYSHTDDEIANWLHRRLETYRIPAALARGRSGRRIGKIFRDRVELSAAHDLGVEIHKALEASDALIVLCSPRSAGSRYVEEEIRFFKQLGRGQQIFAAIVDGEPHAAGKPGRDASEECFPRALLYRVGDDGALSSEPEPAEPIAADVRAGKDGRESGALKLIAGLIGVGLDELVQREKQAERARRRRTQIVAAAMAALAMGAVLAGGYAWWQQGLAEARRVEADQQRGLATRNENLAKQNERVATEKAEAERTARAEAQKIAIDSLWAEAARAIHDGEYQDAFSAVLRGIALDPSRQNEFLAELRWIGATSHAATITNTDAYTIVDAAISPNGHIIASANSNGEIAASDFGTKGHWKEDTGKWRFIAVSASDELVGALTNRDIVLFRAKDGKLYRRIPDDPDSFRPALAISPDGNMVATCGDGAAAYSTRTGKLLWAWSGFGGDAKVDIGPNLYDCIFSEDGRYLALYREPEAAVVESSSGKIVTRYRDYYPTQPNIEGPYYEDLVALLHPEEYDYGAPLALYQYHFFDICEQNDAEKATDRLTLFFEAQQHVRGFVGDAVGERSGAALVSMKNVRSISVAPHYLKVGPEQQQLHEVCGGWDHHLGQRLFDLVQDALQKQMISSLAARSRLTEVGIDATDQIVGDGVERVYGFSPNRRYLAVAGENNRVAIYDLQNASTALGSISSADVVGSLELSDDGELLFLVNRRRYEVWDLHRFVMIDSGDDITCPPSDYCQPFGPLLPDRRSIVLGIDANDGFWGWVSPTPEFWMGTDQLVQILCSRFHFYSTIESPAGCQQFLTKDR